MSLKEQFAVAVVNESNISNTGVTFSVGGTTSSYLSCGGTSPTGIYLPASWLACSLSFLVCKTPNGTFLPLRDFNGNAYAITTTAGAQCIPLSPSLFNSVALYLKLVSSVAQTGAPVVDFALAPIFQGLHA